MVFDEFFPTRLEVFDRMVRDYTTSFTINLKQRRGRGFDVYREFSQFLLNVGRRCIRPGNLAAETDHQGTLTFSMPDVKALCISDFLSGSKLEARLDLACKNKAEAEQLAKKNEGLRMRSLRIPKRILSEQPAAMSSSYSKGRRD